uniref:Uncharacterized protein n=1 Tax=Caenorhabditis japonica TaxID=281687 RepID=A0A8R1I9Q8_CAEJA
MLSFAWESLRVRFLLQQNKNLNPIEYLWEELERLVSGIHARNSDEKFAQLQAAWAQIHQSILDCLVDSMPRRCQSVIDAPKYNIFLSGTIHQETFETGKSKVDTSNHAIFIQKNNK